MKKITYEQALHRLATYCSRAERCRADIKKKMTLWELSDAEQKKLLLYLEKEKFLNEQRFACAFTHDKSTYNRWGAHKIRYELKKKDIPDFIIQEALKSLNPDETQEQLLTLLEQKKRTVKGFNEYEVKQKLIRFASGRGFSIDDIEKALSSLF